MSLDAHGLWIELGFCIGLGFSTAALLVVMIATLITNALAHSKKKEAS